MKKLKINTIFFVFTILWMSLIFCFSARDATESTSDSSRVAKIVCNFVINNFDDLPKEKQDKYLQKLSYPIRKTAHTTEYAILAIWVFLTFSNQIRSRSRFQLSWLFTTLYAGTDEFHQLFVPGRAGQLRDILIDSSGALIGLLFIYLCIQLINGKKVHKKSNTI